MKTKLEEIVSSFSVKLINGNETGNELMDVDTWSPPFRFVYLCDGITITNDFMIIAGRDILL